MKCFPVVATVVFLSVASAQPLGAFFVPNQGQWDGDFLFKHQGPGITCFVTRTGMTLDFREYTPIDPATHPPSIPPIEWREGRVGSPSVRGGTEGGSLRGHVLRLSYVDANSSPEIIGEDKLSSYSNYFLGRDSYRWRSFVPNYQRVVAKDVWPGIDVEYLTHEDGVETLFRVRPGADVSQIALEYEGLERPLEVDPQGNLILHTSLGVVKEKAPWAYQIIGSRRAEVPVSFRILSSTRYGVTLGQYDGSTELVIDPRVIYSSCFAAGGAVTDISLDSEGNIVMVGSTTDAEFPVTPGAYQDSMRGSGDAYLSKMRPDGQSLAYSTYVGGIAGSEHFLEVVVDAQDRMMAGGGTYSEDWTLTAGAFDTVMVGPEPVFVCFSPTGSELLYSTFMGGSGIDQLFDLALDSTSGEAYACGTAGADFPLTPDAVYPTRVGGSSFVFVFDPSVMQIAYSTYFPAAEESGDILLWRVVPLGNRVVWVAGEVWTAAGGMVTPDGFQVQYGGGRWDGYFAQCDLASTGVIYGSFFGGNGDDYCRLVRYPSGNLLLFGVTQSSDFPVTPGAFDTVYSGFNWDSFVSILEPPATLLHSTYLGGENGGGQATDAALSPDEEVILVGFTGAQDFPITADAFDTVVWTDPEYAGDDGFVCKFNPDLSQLLFSTFWGGTEGLMPVDIIGDVLLEGRDSIWVSGGTYCYDFPITDDAFQPCGGLCGFMSHFYIGPGSGTGSNRSRVLTPEDLTLTCYPNPFNATAILRFALPRAGSARLLVYDLLGRKVLDEDLGRLPAGEHRHTLDASDLPSGIYFARLEALGLERVQKMVILR